MAEVISKKAPLEDLMAAMDVVDTLRHQKDIVARELDSDARRERFLERLRDIYAAQGIVVPDSVLQEGISALEEERFQYHPVKPSFSTKLARWYVGRKKWGKPFSFAAIAASMFGGMYFVEEVLPEKQIRANLPQQITATLQEIRAVAKNPSIVQQATTQAESAQAALNNDKLDLASETHDGLESLLSQLRQSYSIKVVSRPNESSGVWRVPDVNETSKNYYLIVEAWNIKNEIVKLPIVSEESAKTKLVAKWGLRVNEQTFYQVSADKHDDGIIQGNKVGAKEIGYIVPNFSVATTGATITEW